MIVCDSSGFDVMASCVWTPIDGHRAEPHLLEALASLRRKGKKIKKIITMSLSAGIPRVSKSLTASSSGWYCASLSHFGPNTAKHLVLSFVASTS